MPGYREKDFIDELRKLVTKRHPEIKVIWKKRDLREKFTEKFREGEGEEFNYEPDVVIEVNGNITHIVEVETDPVRKALVGGACTAAYFVDKYYKELKPKLYFAVGRKNEEYRQLKKQQARLLIIKKWCGNVFSDIKIDKYEEIMKQLKADLGIS